ncbi:MAG: MotA/TolQ/ExbB proton channel family protein [Prevotellaceae bacterium]|jgi:biopolymer transport protein ExbB|nr:MotA/TolQ/ExbB proton channel family protein [Prevotellaceae bacterium]
MKKLFAFVALLGVLTVGASDAFAQQKKQAPKKAATTAPAAKAKATAPAAKAEAPTAEATPETPKADSAVAAIAGAAQVETKVEEVPIHQQLKTKFIEGGPEFMASILICLIIGLAVAIERVIYLNLATTNTDKLLAKLEEALNTGGIDAAKEVCRNTRGPVASIFYQGLDRAHEGVDMAEKSVISYGGVQTARLEGGLSWIGLFIAIAPMLGFLGTVIGMVQAFDAIEAAGDISPTVVAGGIKVALITTIGGLIVAIILQIFYNYILAKVNSLTNQMEDSSISLIDMLIKYNLKK